MINNGYVYRDLVPSEADGQSVIDFYATRYPGFSRSIWLRRIRNGQVRRGAARLEPEDRIRAGEELQYHRPPWEEPPVPTDITVCYRDDRVLVVCKPAGLPTVPGDRYLCHTLLACVRGQFGEHWSPLHRLDRGTSGLVLFAGDRESRRVLGKAMQGGRICKTYLCVTGGCLPDRTVRVTAPIGMVKHPLVGVIAARVPNGRPAVTTFRRIGSMDDNRWLVMARPETGRAHQVRIHAAVAGFPLAGDPVYGRVGGCPDPRARPGEGGFRLHAWRLRFRHPVNDRLVQVTAVPEWWS